MASASYVIGLGSNRRHGQHGAPEGVIRAAIAALEAKIEHPPLQGKGDQPQAGGGVSQGKAGGLSIAGSPLHHSLRERSPSPCGGGLRISRTLRTPAMGPSDRDFANAAVLVESGLSPLALLDLLQRIERDFGRRRYRRWGARVLDLDILLWSGGSWSDRRLTIPHPGLAIRAFALDPAAEIAPGWRHPATGRTLRQLAARLHRRRPVDRKPRTP